MASLMPDKIVAATGIERSHILTGLFTDTSVVGDDNNINVDELPLDYDILEQIDYKYPAGDNYFAYTTRGCPNHCSFCAVPILEPNFRVTNNIIDQIKTIDEKYGPKQHLLLLDNNFNPTSRETRICISREADILLNSITAFTNLNFEPICPMLVLAIHT